MSAFVEAVNDGKFEQPVLRPSMRAVSSWQLIFRQSKVNMVRMTAIGSRPRIGIGRRERGFKHACVTFAKATVHTLKSLPKKNIKGGNKL
jgi:hypothetical protein